MCVQVGNDINRGSDATNFDKMGRRDGNLEDPFAAAEAEMYAGGLLRHEDPYTTR